MAVGSHPDLYGNLTAGAPCASCGGQASMSNAEKYQEYGGQFGPVGLPMPPCEGGNCGQGTFYTPSSGSPRR